MTLFEGFISFACGAETFFEIRGKEAAKYGSAIGFAPAHFRALALMREIFQAEPEGERAIGVSDAVEFLEKFGLAVGS